MEHGHKRKKSLNTDLIAGSSIDMKSEEEALRSYITRMYTEMKLGPYAGLQQRSTTDNAEWKQAFDLFMENSNAVVSALETTAQVSRENVCCYFSFSFICSVFIYAFSFS